MTKIYGTGVALVTPMKADGTLDVEGIRHLVDHVSKEADYLVALGTTGEVATLTTAEKVTVLETVKDQLCGRKPLVLGHGGNDTTKLISQFKDYDFQGVDAILSVSPYYNKPSQTGIQRHYEAIADASPVPVILYNVPGRTGSNVSATTTLKLASHPNIVGTKEASGNVEQCMAIAAAKPSDFLLISGDDLLTPSLIAIGASGAISVLANAYPKEFSTMIRLCQSNDYGSASQIWSNWLDLNPLLYEEGNPVGIKAVLAQMGVCQPFVRLPLANASSDLTARIRKSMA